MTGRSPVQAEGSGGSAVSEAHVYGVITIVLELCLCVENFFPVLLVVCWKRPRERTVSDKLLAALSAIYILSAVVPTPMGLVSYFHGSWYGGVGTCECFQVTSTWCTLAALAVVSYLAVDLHITATSRLSPHHRTPPLQQDQHETGTCYVQEQAIDHALPSPPLAQSSRVCSSSSGKDLANIFLFFIFIVTLLIASLPVVGYGPQVMPDNLTCDSWLIHTPSSSPRRAYFLAFLTFGFLCLATVMLSVGGTLGALKTLRRWTRWEGEPRYMEDSHSHTYVNSSSSRNEDDVTQSSSYYYKMAGLIVVNQVMWIPVLVIVSLQKTGYPVTDATVMYAILWTSLPGLLNPLLLGVLYSEYRLGYRYLLLRLCCCCPPAANIACDLKYIRTRSKDSLHQPQDGELSINEFTSDADDVSSAASKSYPVYACPHVDDTGNEEQDRQSYVVLELPEERTPLQVAGVVNSRPIIASLYDEYGELSGNPKTELLSPCGSEDCLLNPELFRTQTESVV